MRLKQGKLVAVLAVGGALTLAGCSGSSSGGTAGGNAAATTLQQQQLGAPAATPSHSLSSAAGGGKSAPGVAGSGSAASVGQSAVVLTPLVVRTGDVTLGVSKHRIVSAFNSVSTIALSLGGFVQSSSTGVGNPPPPVPQPLPAGGGVSSSPSTPPSIASGASLVVRVPTDQFESLQKQVDSLGRVRFQNIAGQDVSGQSINLRARITNLESEQSALRALMSRTGSIPNILQVQNELFSVEGEIESLTADESSLLNRATYATLSVDLQPLSVAVAPKHKPHQNAVVRALRLAGHNSVVALRDVALAIGWAFPILLVALAAGAAWWLRRRVMRRRRVPAAAMESTAG